MAIYLFYYFFIVVIYFLSNRIVLLEKNKQSSRVKQFKFLDEQIINSKFSLAYSGRKKSKESWFVFFAFLILLLIIGFRNQSMGVDLIGYLPSFDKLNTYSMKQILSLDSYLNYEKGYVIFNKIVGIFYNNKQFFLFVCALFSLIPIGILILNESRITILSLYIYLGIPPFLLLFSGLRQALAIGITVCSFKFLKERKFLPFAIIVILASTFHTSAFVFIIAYPIYGYKMKKSIALGSIISLPIIWYLRTPVFQLAVNLLSINVTIDNNGAINLFIIFTLIYLFSTLFVNRENSKANGLSNLFFVACLIQALGGVYSIVIRLGYYFMIYLILLIPEIISDMKNMHSFKERKIVLSCIYISFIYFGLYFLRNGGWAESYPYYAFW